MQAPRRSWKERAFYLSYWSEKGDEKEALLGGLMRFLVPQKYFVVRRPGLERLGSQDRAGLVEPGPGSGLHRESRRTKAAAARALRHAAVAARRLSCCAPMRRRRRSRSSSTCRCRGGGGRGRPALRRAHRLPHGPVRPPDAPASSRPWRGARGLTPVEPQGRGRSRRRPAAPRGGIAPPWALAMEAAAVPAALPDALPVGARPGLPDRRLRSVEALAAAARHRRCAGRQAVQSRPGSPGFPGPCC